MVLGNIMGKSQGDAFQATKNVGFWDMQLKL